MERTSGVEYFNETIVSKRDSLVEMKCCAATQRLQERRGRVRGAIRTEETADESLIDGDAYSATQR